MSKIVRVQNGDYKVIVGGTNAAGHIVLDTFPVEEFDFSVTYQPSTVVTYYQKLYRALQVSTGILPTNTSYWEQTEFGSVTIKGDLNVFGNTTTIDSETLTIKDNIIYLNVGESGDGVSTAGTTSGFQIDRGSPSDGKGDVSVLWSETLQSEYPPTAGTFVFVDSTYIASNPTTLRNALRPIATNAINSGGGDLQLISSGNGIVTVAGTTDYEDQVLEQRLVGETRFINAVGRSGNVATVVTSTPHPYLTGDRVNVECYSDTTFNATDVSITVVSLTRFEYANTGSDSVLTVESGIVLPIIIKDDDTIPNMKAVEQYTSTALATYVSDTIRKNDTKIQVYDDGASPPGTGLSEVVVDIDGTFGARKVVINKNGLKVGNIIIDDNNIGNDSNDNILFDSVLNIPTRTTLPTDPNPGHVKLYAKSLPGNGGTGLFFVALNGSNPSINDELVSKTRALLYSLIL